MKNPIQSRSGRLSRRALLLLLALVPALPIQSMAAAKAGVASNKPAGLPIAPGPVAGESFTLVLRPDGSLWGWGSNNEGQLAVGDDRELWALGVDVSSKYPPTRIGGDFVAVAAGDAHVLALKADGSLWAWGQNRKGQLGDGTETSRFRPVLVGQGFVKAFAGANQSFGIKADGSLWAWGDNDFGQLGDGTRARRNKPVAIGNGYLAVATGFVHSLALKADGSLWAWGANYDGQHGDGTIIARDNPTQRLMPVQVGDGYKQISVSTRFSAAIKTDGSLWAWGLNDHGRIGDGSDATRATPVKVGDGFQQLSASSHMLALKTDGSLWSWGYNGHGQLGDGSSERNRKTPAQIGTDFKAVAAGGYHSVAVKKDGSIWTWGSDRGLVERAGSQDRSLPAAVSLPLPAKAAARGTH